MSVSIKNNVIAMTRGDTLTAHVRVFRMVGNVRTEYTPQEGDVIRFALKHNLMNRDRTEYADAEPLIRKEIPIDTMVLILEPEDTKGLGFGSYAYDVEITFSDGTVDTFIPDGKFTMKPEVD